jgi:hypothetical protein
MLYWLFKNGGVISCSSFDFFLGGGGNFVQEKLLNEEQKK